MGRKCVEARTTKRWEPQTWKPRYDIIVYYHCLGKSNEEIAEKVGIGSQAISNVLVSLQGRARIKIIQDRLLGNIQGDLGQRLHNVAEKFMRKIEIMAEDDNLFEKHPFAVIDRGLAIIKNLGINQSAPTTPANVNNPSFINNGTMIGRVIMSDEAANNLKAAIADSDEVREIHEHGPFALIQGGASDKKAS